METKEYIVTVFSENQIGVLNRITATYLRRKINIESLRVSESSIKGISMFVISAFSTEEIIEKVVKQIRKIIEVLEAEYRTADELITQEMALYKISSKAFSQHHSLEVVTRNNNARIIEMTGEYIVVEMTGSREEVERFRDELASSGSLEQFSRSGVVMHRESIEEKLNHFI